MATQGKITKIYKLETIGYDSLHKQFTSLSDDLLKIKKLIIDLQGQKIGLSGSDLTKVNEQIIAAVDAEKKLETQIGATNDASQTSINTYFQLNKAYQLAKTNAQDLAVSHGIESKEALEAAAAAEVYKQKLIEINALVKSGGKPLATVVPITPVVATPVQSITTPNASPTDIANLEKTGAVITDLEQKEADATNAAFALGQANQQAAAEIVAAGVDISKITTKYEEFTGSIRQNIIAQIENNNQLIQNRGAQKDIQSVINSQGFGTSPQINQLAALKEEEQLLIESNKSLSVTIRNQSKEFLADAESTDLFQAQLNQLQQTYEQLTAAEKASPFGQRMKAEIDILEPKVKSLEAELGKFSRNVGNYPQIFGGAFKVLETELDVVHGKLVNGNFSGTELASLTAQEQVLSNATKTLGQQFSSTAAQQAAFKEQGRQLALVFGADSAVFKQFSAQVIAANTTLKQTDVQLNATEAKGRSVFKSLYGGLRQIANIIPGLGISSLVLLLLTPLESLATSIGNVGRESLKARQAISDFAERQKIVKDITNEAIKGYAEEVTRIEILGKIITNHALTIDKRRIAADQYNKIADEGNKIDKQAIDNTKLIEESINRQIVLIQKRALAKASENVIAKKAEELFLKQFELEERFPAESEARIKELKDKTQAVIDEASKKLQVKPAKADEVLAFIDLPKDVIAQAEKGNAGLKVALDDRTRILLTSFNNQLKLIESNRKNLTGGNAGLSVLVDDIANLNTELERVTKVGLGFIADVGGELEKPTRTKDTELQNQLKTIETSRLLSIALENKRVNDIEKIRKLNFDEEIFHLNQLQQINVDALNKKISLYNVKETGLLLEKKKLNAEDRKDRAEFGEQITTIELDTSKKINDIEKKRFENNVKVLQDKLTSELSQITINKDTIINDINSTELQKAQAQLDADNKELEAKKRFYVALLFLNDRFNLESLVKAKDAIAKQQQEVNKDRAKIPAATFSDLGAASDKEIQATRIRFGLLRREILDNDKLTSEQRKKQLDNLGAAEQRTILAIELKTLQAQFELTKTLFSFGLITEKAFLDVQQKFVDKANELQGSLVQSGVTTTEKVKESFSGLQDFVSQKLTGLFGIDTNTEEGKQLAGVVGKVVAESFDLAQKAMTDYFDAERQRIEESLKLNLERLDIEEAQVKARATSQAEIDSIDKQYAAKKRVEEQKAHEELKKSKRSEAKLAFAVELANIWAQAMSYVFPLDLIIGGVLSGLAAARLSLRLNEINRETFEKGGIPGERKSFVSRTISSVKNVFNKSNTTAIAPTKTGGEVQGPSHKQGGVRFNYEAQGKELMIINKISAQDTKIRTITGTNKQIASKINELGGGISFAKGAKTYHFETGGYLGTSLQAPVFVPASNNIISQPLNTNNEKFDELITAVKDHQKATDHRIDRFEVNLVTNKVTEHQKKLKQYSDVGTL